MSTAATEEAGSLSNQARAWYEANWDPELPAGQWYRRMMESRWAYPTWPENWWGRGLSGADARAVREARRAVGALGPPSGIGPTLLAPMLFTHGAAAQSERFLWGMGADGWITCQMLSEPDAGSDLAAVRTTAERDGDEWVITGSKIWTSNASYCDFGMLLARTNWDAPKHRGLTFFLVPVHQDGVDIRPLRQMTGDAQFNQVFFDGARVADGDRLGAVDDGWAVTRTFLAHEKNSYNPASHEGGVFGRVPLDRPAGEVQERERARSIAAAQGRGIGRVLTDLVRTSPLAGSPIARQAQARLHTRRQLMTYTNQRVRAERGRAANPGWEGAASKLTVSDLTRGQRDLGLAALGPAGMLAGADAPSEAFVHFSLHSPSLSIAGGTDEIQRNSLAEKVLGLPAEPKADANLPFRDIPG